MKRPIFRDLPLALLVSVLGTTACTSTKKQPGELVVTIDTDMDLPSQVDTLRVEVLVHGETFLNQDYPVGTPDANPIPATISLLVGKDPSTPAHIRVSGGKLGGAWRTFREVVTTVPADRSATLRMPVQWLCDGTAMTTQVTDDNGNKTDEISSSCPVGATCMAGTCKQNEVAAADLPDFHAEDVYGGASEPSQGTCFDTLSCMLQGKVVEPDAACTVANPGAGAGLNVALRVPGGGICDETNTTCFVPLNAHSSEGWSLTAGDTRIQLPAAACDKLNQGEVSAIYVSTACASKTESIPACGDWSNVTGAKSAPPPDTQAPHAPAATKLGTFVASGSKTAPCCPLMNDGTLLYTCICQSTATATASLTSLPIAGGQANKVFDFDTPATRQNELFAAQLSDGTFFWVDAVQNSIQRRSLATGNASPVLTLDGEITEATPLAVNDASMYLLASAVSGAMGSPVQLLTIDRAVGTVRSSDTGANFHVHQFADDDSFVYVVQNVNTTQGTSTSRSSTVVRIQKSDGSLSPVSPTSTVLTSDKSHGGYLGVQTDLDGGGGLYALYEDAPQTDGTIPTRVVAFDAKSGMPSTLFERDLDPKQSSLWLLGAAGGTVLVARIESTAGGAAVASSSVLALPAVGGSPLIVADFVSDYPLLGLQALTGDAESLYWLNASGDVYALARAGLAN